MEKQRNEHWEEEEEENGIINIMQMENSKYASKEMFSKKLWNGINYGIQ